MLCRGIGVAQLLMQLSIRVASAAESHVVRFTALVHGRLRISAKKRLCCGPAMVQTLPLQLAVLCYPVLMFLIPLQCVELEIAYQQT
jgi:hypothetical protein